MRKRVAIRACGLTVPAVSTIIRKAILLTLQPACRTPAPLRLLTNSFPPPSLSLIMANRLLPPIWCVTTALVIITTTATAVTSTIRVAIPTT